MLILTRKPGQEIIIGDNEIIVQVMSPDDRGNGVRIGVTAPPEITVHRKEVYDRIQEEKGNKKKVVNGNR